MSVLRPFFVHMHVLTKPQSRRLEVAVEATSVSRAIACATDWLNEKKQTDWLQEQTGSRDLRRIEFQKHDSAVAVRLVNKVAHAIEVEVIELMFEAAPLKPLKLLAPTRWRKVRDGYEQQDRARLVRLGKTAGWILFVDGKCLGRWSSLREAKARASEIAVPQ